MPPPRFLGGREKRGRTSASSACLLIYQTHHEIHLQRLRGPQVSKVYSASSAEPEAGAETVGKAYSLSHSIPAFDVPPRFKLPYRLDITLCGKALIPNTPIFDWENALCALSSQLYSLSQDFA